jgi:hypothetical protein
MDFACIGCKGQVWTRLDRKRVEWKAFMYVVIRFWFHETWRLPYRRRTVRNSAFRPWQSRESIGNRAAELRPEPWHIFKTDLDRTYYRSHFSLISTLTAKRNSQSQQSIAASLNFCRLAFVRKPEVSEQCSVVMFLTLAKKNVWFERRQTLQHFNVWLRAMSPDRNLPKSRLYCRITLFWSVFTHASRENKQAWRNSGKTDIICLFNAHRILMVTDHLRVTQHRCLTWECLINKETASNVKHGMLTCASRVYM